MELRSVEQKYGVAILSFVLIAVFAGLEWRFRYHYNLHEISEMFETLKTEVEKESLGFQNSIDLVRTTAETMYAHSVRSEGIRYFGPSKIHPYGFDLEAAQTGTSDYGNLTALGTELDAAKLQEIHMALSLTPLLQRIKANSKSEVPWVYYTSDNFIYLYPFVSAKEFFFSEKDLLEDKDFYRLGRPEVNPNRKAFWTKPYVDSAGEGLMVTLAEPVYHAGRFLGTVAVDFKFSVFARLLKNLKIKYGNFLLLSPRLEELSAMDYASGVYSIEENALVPADLSVDEKSWLQGNISSTTFTSGPWLYNIDRIDAIGVTMLYKAPILDVLVDSLKSLQFSFVFAVFVIASGAVWRFYQTMEAEKYHAAEENNRLAALGEMCGGIAHEINNPLSIIKGNISLCRRSLEKHGAEKADFLKERLEKCDVTVDRIGDIIQGLRFFSKDYDTTRHERFRLQEVLEMTYPLLSGKLKRNHIEFSSELPDQEIELIGVRVELSQVLINLVNNAIDALAPLTHEKLWIRFNISCNEDQTVCIEVQDSGRGIDDKIIGSVFRPFFSTKSRMEKDRFGLGLSICRGIVEAHRGTITYAKPGGISTFRITLPRAKGGSESAAA